MKRLRLALCIAVIAVFGLSTYALAAIPVDVTVGKGTILTLKKTAKRISLTDPEVADLLLISPTEILLNGKEVGVTSLITWDEQGNRTFFDVIVFGDINELREKVKALAPAENVIVERVTGSIMLKGSLRNEETIAKIETVSKRYAGSVINFLRVKEPQQVLLEVKVAQINRIKLKQMGISFLIKHSTTEATFPNLFAGPDGSLGGGPGAVTPGLGAFDIEDIVPELAVANFPAGVATILRALQQRGLAKVLAEPNLIVRSGEEGEFLAGAEVPVQTITGIGVSQTVSITFKEVGVKLNFAPVVLEDGIIRLKIDPAEVSTVSSFESFGGIVVPQIDTRKVATSVDLRSGESLILAGMLSEDTTMNLRKIPLLGDIPILGALFRSSVKEINESELAFFITPRLVTPNPPGEPAALEPARELTPEEEMQYEWVPATPPKE